MLALEIQCYHYVNDTDSKGRSRRRRVNTHHAKEEFVFYDWVDTSAPPDSMNYIDLFLLSRFNTLKNIVLSPPVQARFNAQKLDFLARNNRDVFYDFRFVIDIADYRPHCITLNANLGFLPLLANRAILNILDVFAFGWIQIFFLDILVTRVEYTLEKVILD